MSGAEMWGWLFVGVLIYVGVSALILAFVHGGTRNNDRADAQALEDYADWQDWNDQHR